MQSVKISLNKNDVIEADIDDIAVGGEGIAHVEGAAVFVRGAIKGERVRAKIIYAGKNYCVAILDKILKSSPVRRDAPCPYFPKCGGCTLQHIEYDAQTDFKTESLKNTLKKQGIDASAVLPAIKSDKEFFYRNKLTLPVRYPNKIGFFRAESHSVVDIDDCLLQNFDCKEIIALLKSFMEKFSLAGYDEQSGKGDIRHIAVRYIGNLLCVCVVSTRNIKKELKDFYKSLVEFCDKQRLTETDSAQQSPKESAPIQISPRLWGNVNAKKTNVIFSDEFYRVDVEDDETTIDGLKISVHPAAFFQVNDYIRELIYSAAAQEVKDSPVVIDAYSGAGILSAKLAKSAKKVIAVEINENAHASAVGLIKNNGIQNLTPVLGDCAEELDKILSDIKECENATPYSKISIVLDPPRSGVDKRVIDAVLRAKPKKVVYISCNPATLARDLYLLSTGYSIKNIQPYDMFPQTPSLEVLCVLEI